MISVSHIPPLRSYHAGVGFNSVYHLTEVPTFVSGPYIVMFDPQARYLPNINPANPGKVRKDA
jgi:sacsin